jgi:hypothetical protein
MIVDHEITAVCVTSGFLCAELSARAVGPPTTGPSNPATSDSVDVAPPGDKQVRMPCQTEVIV